MSKSISFTRRQFLRGTGACVAAFAAVPGSVLRSSGQGSANEKLNIAGIGVGGQGGADIDAMAGEGQNIVALCDVDDNYAAKKFQQYSKAKKFKDFRVMLDSMGKEIIARKTF